MRKIIFQGLVVVLLFFATWLLLSQVNWVRVLRIKQMTQTTEEKLGELLWEIFRKSDKVMEDADVVQPLDSLLARICDGNGFDKDLLQLHVLKRDEVNAFALPNRTVVIYSGLIAACDNESELAGVIAHELAHIQLNHVMKKLIKEVGLSVIISATTGNTGADVMRELARVLSSSAYDRGLEREADRTALRYLEKAEIDPEGLATFLFKLSQEEPSVMKNLAWISTHPDTEERARNLMQKIDEMDLEPRPVLKPETWERLQAALSER